jgi:predicted alpha/beta-hydrolase family hydrolase
VSGVVEVATPHGPARLHHHAVAHPRATLVLGHSASGGVHDPALLAAVRGAAEAEVAGVLVEQPYRVAGRRMPAPAGQVDTALLSVLAHLRSTSDLPLVTGGRSFGGRVACRTSLRTDVSGVLCLAFPLLPAGAAPEKSRLPELDAVQVPALVVQGDRDPFGRPPQAPGRALVLLAADHSLRTALPQVQEAVRAWLEVLLSDGGGTVGA